MNMLESPRSTTAPNNVAGDGSVLFSSTLHNADNFSAIFMISGTPRVCRAYGLTSGYFDVYSVCPFDTSIRTPVIVDGVPLRLSAANTLCYIETEGMYALKAVGVTRYSATVTAELTVMKVPDRLASAATSNAIAVPSGALSVQVDTDFAYANGNTILNFTDATVNTIGAYATWEDDSTFTVVDGVWDIEAQCRVISLSGGSYFKLSLMSGLNVIAQDTCTWGDGCTITALKLSARTLVSSDFMANKALHVQIETDADTTNAFFYPSGTKVIAVCAGAVA